ncbi:MAG: winged helix-turn-helix domain-containing protein [Gammaproteobacteria bacterium]
MHVLVVEDDELLGDALQAGLRDQGFTVSWVRDGLAADTLLRTGDCSALVLDLGLPRRGGLEILRSLRAAGNRLPVLVLTSRDAVEDRVTGLDSGADDYVIKPVAISELAARLRALIRRAHGQGSDILTVGGLMLNGHTRQVRFCNQDVELQPREFDLLRQFMLNSGRVLTREQLENRLYDWDQPVESNTIEVYIHHLRRKLAPDVIRTVRGVGYLLPTPVDN